MQRATSWGVPVALCARQAGICVPFLQHAAHDGNGGALGRSCLSAATGTAMGARRAQRLRYFLKRDTALQGTVLRIFLSVVERWLREHSPGCPAAARIGAVAFIRRFGQVCTSTSICALRARDSAARQATVASSTGYSNRLSPRMMRRASALMPPSNLMLWRLPTCRLTCEPVSCAPSSNVG